MDLATLLIFLVPTLVFAPIAWLWFQAINKVILKLFRGRKSILTETLKWSIFMSSTCFVLLSKAMRHLFNKDSLEFVYLCGALVLYIAVARIISLLIKKLILFIAKKIKKESKAEIVAEAISWGIFAFALVVATFYISFSVCFPFGC